MASKKAEKKAAIETAYPLKKPAQSRAPTRAKAAITKAESPQAKKKAPVGRSKAPKKAIAKSVASSGRRTPSSSGRRTPILSERRTPIPSERRTPIPSERRTPIPSERRTPIPSERRTPIPKEKVNWQLRLYVAGDSPRSRLALTNLRKLCEERLKDDYEIQVIDLTKVPHLAKADQILAIPTLVRSIPAPMKRIIGDLSNADRALIALDLDKLGPKTP